MNSLRDIVQPSPQLRVVGTNAAFGMQGDTAPQPLAPARWDWEAVRRVLVVRLRSIGDTVLATPSVFALKRFLPHAQVDILVEDWVAPLLENHPHVDNVVVLERGGVVARTRVAGELRAKRYDVVYNLHGGTTATFLTRATGARHRVGFETYQYAKLHTELAPSPLLLWGQQKAHSVEQQLALLGWTGVPVTDRPRTQLGISPLAVEAVNRRLAAAGLADQKIALIHPAAAFETKRWATENFAGVAEFVTDRGFAPVAIAAPHETQVINDLLGEASVRIVSFSLSLPEVTALAARSQLFVGNDSGIAHIAAAVGTPSVVIFGSSNVAAWRPWSRAAAEVVFEQMPCQPCHGYFCEKFPQPECILRVPAPRVLAAIERCLN
ncbi:MAG: glycosyltransferase family 9 protein [Acidobacteria bacterium]|nr:glycosyltransferase family 9 protein [Acidobacteriota bacterium]MCA1627570.1 glycosyltransferase family 9 protein [Acidobacteriota bacterium]